MKSTLLAFLYLFFLVLITFDSKAQSLAIVPYSTGISSPIDIKNCGDDRLFIADKGGFIRVINPDGTLRSTPFLDISSKIYLGTGEDGFFGMVFSPNYKADGKFFVHYTSYVGGHIMVNVEQYKVSVADSNVADVSSALTLLTQLSYSKDDLGGNLMFGFDGYLYINIGDGGVPANGQLTNTFLGKILRLDVSNSSVATPYIIPPSNQFYNDTTTGIKKEIWVYGVRNPFRNSIDIINGDYWIADVGASAREEIDYKAANSSGSLNFGWSIMEGDTCYNSSVGCDTTGLKMPIYTYTHAYGSAIIGGYVYRSAQSKALFGTYLYGDYGKKWIDGITQSGGSLSGPVKHFITSAQGTGNIISFGEDKYNDLYMVFDNDQTVYKLEDTSYLRRPKAYFTPVSQNGGTSYLLQGLQGRNMTYHWLINNVPIPSATSSDYNVTSNGNYNLVVTDSLGFSDTSAVFPFGALPLNLISFTAQKITTGKTGLQWKTANEQNINGYTILRKKDNEVNFSKIGFVQSKSSNGISNNEIDYAFVDSSAPLNSTLYYRLQIQNIDSRITYSNICTIVSDGKNLGFNFYPNPSKGKLHIDLNGYTQPAVMIIYDSKGQKVKAQVLNVQSSTIDLSSLKGFYIVQISGTHGESIIRKKLLVE